MTAPAPIALYVHWPYCARICPYCDFNVARYRGDTDAADALFEAILADLRAQAAKIGPRPLYSLFFGGGTPSLLPPESVHRLIDEARRLFPSAGDIEISLEANPHQGDAERFQALKDAGVNRLSLGVQSFNDARLTFLGRDHDAQTARQAVEAALKTFERVSLDLIYALPDETPAVLDADIDAVLAYGPEHISPYQLTLEPGTALARAAARGRFRPLPSDAGALAYEQINDRLGAAGYQAYEVSNHARGPKAYAQHNLFLWRGGDYAGIGPGAHGRVTHGGVRYAQVCEPDLKAYPQRVANFGTGLIEDMALTHSETAAEAILVGLRLSEGLPRDAFLAAPLFLSPTRLDALTQQGLLVQAGDRVFTTPAGRLVLDAVLGQLLT